jgi:hypothetical protein
MSLPDTRIKVETYFVELLFSFRIHAVSFKGVTLHLDPIAQFRVKDVSVWH